MLGSVIFSTVLVLSVLAVPSAQATVSSIVVEGVLSNGKPNINLHDYEHQNWNARCNYTNEINDTGWAYLELQTNNSTADDVQAYAAGYLEGAATHQQIYDSWRNTMEGFCEWKGAEYCEKLRLFIDTNNAYMNRMISTHNATDPYWHHVNLVLKQLEGLVDGYNSVAVHNISAQDLYWMNLSGDLDDLDGVFGLTSTSTIYRGDGHCSAIIKLLPGNADLYTAHVSWNRFQSMLRIQKKYSFQYAPLHDDSANNIIAGHTATFSSYPGYIHSWDDYYLLSSGLASIETTIGNSNDELYVNVKPTGQVFEWIRVLVANRLSTDGKSWTDYLGRYNSGTYNNQWMIVDYKLFTPLERLKPNTLWILEQLPGLIVAEDQTQLLEQQTYWPSYNVPFYPEVFNTSGLPALVEEFGDWFSYDKTSRGLIFARDHTKVKDMDSLFALMRYNDYKNDPLSACDCDPPYSGENAISARSDLNPANGTYPFPALGHRNHGATDVKATSLAMFKDLEYLAICGPTSDQQPVFKWSTSGFDDVSRHGLPDVFDFPIVHKVWGWN